VRGRPDRAVAFAEGVVDVVDDEHELALRWRAAAAAHAEVFTGIDPANTSLFVSGLFVPGALIEVEVDAVVAEPASSSGHASDPLRSLIVEVLNERASTGSTGVEPGGQGRRQNAH
jgi:hypothetical protein